MFIVYSQTLDTNRVYDVTLAKSFNAAQIQIRARFKARPDDWHSTRQILKVSDIEWIK